MEPTRSIAAMLNMHFAGIVPLHQKEVIVRIRNAIKVMSTILSDEKLSGIEARKHISKVQELAVNQIHNELTQQGNQITSMLSFLACIVAITIYLAVAPLDKSISSNCCNGNAFPVLFSKHDFAGFSIYFQLKECSNTKQYLARLYRFNTQKSSLAVPNSP